MSWIRSGVVLDVVFQVLNCACFHVCFVFDFVFAFFVNVIFLWFCLVHFVWFDLFAMIFNFVDFDFHAISL